MGSFLGVLPLTARLTILGEFRSHLACPYLGFNVTIPPPSYIHNGLTETSQTQLHLHRLRLPTTFHITQPLNRKDFASHYQSGTGSVSSLRRGSRTPHARIAPSQDSTYSHTIRACVQRWRKGAGRVPRPSIFVFYVLARQRGSSGAGSDSSERHFWGSSMYGFSSHPTFSEFVAFVASSYSQYRQQRSD